MASIALFESFNEIMQQGIRALHSRRLPLVHLSRIKQEHAMIGVDHFLSALLTDTSTGEYRLTDSQRLRFQGELAIFRVASRESSDLQVMLF